jgi:hypothetical protein
VLSATKKKQAPFVKWEGNGKGTEREEGIRDQNNKAKVNDIGKLYSNSPAGLIRFTCQIANILIFPRLSSYLSHSTVAFPLHSSLRGNPPRWFILYLFFSFLIFF